MTWREHAAPIIARVLRQTVGQDEKAIRRALHDAYPFGRREHWPYKVWLDEVRRQRKGGPRLGDRKSPRSTDNLTRSLFP